MLSAMVLVVVVISVVVYRSTRVRADTVRMDNRTDAVFRDTETGKLLEAYEKEIYEEDADGKTDNLTRLQQNPESAIEELQYAYDEAPAVDHCARWDIVYIATMLERSTALPFLKNISESEIAGDAPKDRHRFTDIQAELTIRVRAVEGVRLLAAAGEQEAHTLLLRLVKSAHFSTRRAAAHALLSLDDGEAYHKQIAELLPEREHFIFNLEEAVVEKAGIIGRPTESGGVSAASTAPEFKGEVAAPTKIDGDRRGPPAVTGGM